MFSFLSMQEPGVRAALEEVSYLETGRASVWHVGKEGPILAVIQAPCVQTPNRDLSGPWRGGMHSPASCWGNQIMSQPWGDRGDLAGRGCPQGGGGWAGLFGEIMH